MNAFYVIHGGFDMIGIMDVVSREPAVIGATQVLW